MLLGSGVGWIVLHYAFIVAGPFGPAPNPLEAWALKVHGAAMMAFLVLAGTVLPLHVRGSWQMGYSHRSGTWVLAISGFLALTGYALYYLSSEGTREWLGIVHWAAGLGAGVAYFWHVLPGRRSAPARSLRRPEVGP